MSDYNPTYTCQWRDYEEAKRLREKWWRKVEQRRQRGESLLEAVRPQKVGHMPTAPVITEERPNPLSMELRIVLLYFWELYRKVEQRIAAFRAAGVPVRPDLKVERQDCLDTARNLCYDLFEVTSCFHPFHIHSMYGCNNDDCPLWGLGYEAAQENVLDWYEPNS